MTAPLVTARDGNVLLIPQDVSLDELAERVHEWEAARDYRQALWDNRTGAGPTLDKAEAIEQTRFYEVRDLIGLDMPVEDFATEIAKKSPAMADRLAALLIGKAWQARNPEAVA